MSSTQRGTKRPREDGSQPNSPPGTPEAPAVRQRHANQYPIRPQTATTAAAAASSAPASPASATSSGQYVRPKQPNQYTKKRLAAEAAAAAKGGSQPAAALRPPHAPPAAQLTPPRPKQPNQYTYRTASGVAPASPASAVSTPPRSKQPMRAASLSQPAPPARPKQPNQYTYRTTPKPPAAPKTAPKPASASKPSQHKQPNQYTYRSESGGSAAAAEHRKQPNQYTYKRASSAGSASSPAAAAAPKVKQPHQHSHGIKRHPNQYAIVSSSSSGPVVLHPGRKNPASSSSQPGARDKLQQVGPVSAYSPRTHYTPPVFLRASMPQILKRVAQVLDRDLTSRRQVAALIGVSQSKISRLLHGRSPFRNADEEFHLRHWLYVAEKAFIAPLQSALARGLDRQRVLDFASLPPPLNTLSPPQDLVLYLHFLLPLDQRARVDKIVAQALGIATHEGEQREGSDAESDDDDEEDTRPSKPPPAPAPPPPQLTRAERLALRRAQGEAEEDGPPLPEELEERARKRVKVEEASEQSSPSSAVSDAVCGLDAWTAAPAAVVQRRLAQLMLITHTSQGDIGRLLDTSAATVSMILRGEFRYSTYDKFMSRMQAWGRATDQLLVTRAASMLGAEHDDSINEFDGMREESIPEADDSANEAAVHHCMFIKDILQPRMPRRSGAAGAKNYATDLLRMSSQEELDEQHRTRTEDSLPARHDPLALEELAQMLVLAGIPLQSDDADAAPSPSSATSSAGVQTLSLDSWLRFTCRFSERTRVDELVTPWLSRWSGAVYSHDDTPSAEWNTAADIDAHWSLERDQIAALGRFKDYLAAYQPSSSSFLPIPDLPQRSSSSFDASSRRSSSGEQEDMEQEEREQEQENDAQEDESRSAGQEEDDDEEKHADAGGEDESHRDEPVEEDDSYDPDAEQQQEHDLDDSAAARSDAGADEEESMEPAEGAESREPADSRQNDDEFDEDDEPPTVRPRDPPHVRLAKVGESDEDDVPPTMNRPT